MSAIDALIGQLQQHADSGPSSGTSTKGPRGTTGKPVEEDGTSTSTSFSARDASDSADELLALQSIYGDENVLPVHVQGGKIQETGSADRSPPWQPQGPIRISVTVALDISTSGTGVSSDTGGHDRELASSDQPPAMRICAVIPPGYPHAAKSTPQLQLLSRYIGPHGVDHVLFGQILRIFRQEEPSNKASSPAIALTGGSNGDGASGPRVAEHVVFVPGQVALFDGIDKARELVEAWFRALEAERGQRSEAMERAPGVRPETGAARPDKHAADLQQDMRDVEKQAAQLSTAGAQGEGEGDGAESVHLVSAPALTERKSTFVGHAAYLAHPGQVAPSLAHLVESDRRIARATHPTMHAWVCRTPDGIVHRDCDDDGETAAGGRLAHLLDILVRERDGAAMLG